jgi:hypothetical protein
MINRLWIEQNLSESEMQRDNADVLVETENGLRWRAAFVTVPFLQRQMQLNRAFGQDMEKLHPVRFAAIETPHVIVDNLLESTIEDTVDNLMTLGVFESVFTLCPDEGLLVDAIFDGPITSKG